MQPARRQPSDAAPADDPRATWRRWLGALPRPCAVCRQWGRSGLCSDCRTRFVDAAPARCPRCALRSPGGQTCGACLRDPPPFSHAVALADYAFPWDRLITRLKFQQQPELAGLLADALAGAVRAVEDRPAADWLVPLPLSAARLAERGYNQAWELARRMPPLLGAAGGTVARADLLQRLRDTPHQVGLGRRAREANLRHTMWVPPEAQRRIAGCRIALVDDVMTTGVTAAAATQALLAAGAADVQVWVLARTPAPGD
jgi:ComF family protein